MSKDEVEEPQEIHGKEEVSSQVHHLYNGKDISLQVGDCWSGAWCKWKSKREQNVDDSLD